MSTSVTAYTRQPLLVRTGMPQPSGRLIAAAKARNYPILCSANAFAVRYPPGHRQHREFRKFRLPRPSHFRGLNVALDSAGFVASVIYGEYPWTVNQYLDLVASAPWTWWAAMDHCCEPEIAANKWLRILRIAATVARYYQCLRAARRRGLPDPMPVLQGWTIQEYLLCVDWFRFTQWPSLIGVGSVCRRPVHSANGVLEIIDALDRVLPSTVRLHLFGVKSEALSALANHPRVASTDSMAWDAAARRARPIGRDTDFRIKTMEHWMTRQTATLSHQARGGGVQTTLPILFEDEVRTDFEAVVLEALALEHAALLVSNEISYLDAVAYVRHDAVTAIRLVRQAIVTPKDLADLDELIAGLADRVADLWLSRDRPFL